MSLRISHIIEYSPTKDAFIQSIGVHNIATLEEMSELHLYDFGIFIELMPDEEEKAMLENNIQMSLQQQTIDLEDAIDVREINNVKLANQVLKIRRNRKIEQDQLMKQQNMQAQAQANSQQQQVAAEMEVQKRQALAQSDAQLEQLKAQLELQKMQQEIQAKQQLMQLEFEFNMRLKGLEVETTKRREKEKEDRKDERTRIQATQQSELIEQRKGNQAAKRFESSGNDVLGGESIGDLSQFGPR